MNFGHKMDIPNDILDDLLNIVYYAT